jgi:hypothetical protein
MVKKMYIGAIFSSSYYLSIGYKLYFVNSTLIKKTNGTGRHGMKRYALVILIMLAAASAFTDPLSDELHLITPRPSMTKFTTTSATMKAWA